MVLLARALQQRLVGGVLDQRVLDRESAAGRVHEAFADELLDPDGQQALLLREDFAQQLEGPLAADRRAELNDLLGLRRHPVEPRHQQILQRRRHHRVRQRPDQLVPALGLAQRPRIEEHPRHLLDVERIAIRLGDQQRQHLRRQRLVADDAADHHLRVRRRQLIDVQHGEALAAEPRRRESGPRREQKQQPVLRQLRDDAAEEFQRRRVDPVQVLDDEERRRRAGAGRQQRDERGDRLLLLRQRMQPERLVAGLGRDAEQLREQRERRVDLAAVLDQALAKARETRVRRVVVGELVAGAQRRHHRIERRAAVVGRAVALDDLALVRADRFAEHREQARLADAGLAQQQHGVPRAVARGEPRFRQRGHRALASDIGSEPLLGRGFEAVPRPARGLDAKDLDRLGEPFHRMLAERRHFEESGDQALRRAAHHDRIRRRELLDARGDVRCVAQGEALGAGGAAQVPDQRQAGVNRDAHREVDVEARSHAGREVGDRPHDLEARLHAATGVVLVRDRIAEVDHDAVALELRGRALVALDDLGADLTVGADQVAQVLRIERPRHLHGSHEVAEHHRHVAPFDHRVRFGAGRSARRAADGSGERRPALMAEARPRRDLRVACRAVPSQRRTARRAEIRSVRIAGPAVRALHRRSAPAAIAHAAARSAGAMGPAGQVESARKIRKVAHAQFGPQVMRTMPREDQHRLGAEDDAADPQRGVRDRQRERTEPAIAVVQNVMKHESRRGDAHAQHDPVEQEHGRVQRSDEHERRQPDSSLARKRRADAARANPRDERPFRRDERVAECADVAAFDLMQLRIGGAGAAAMVAQVQRPMLAVTEPERGVEDHRQPMECRDPRRRPQVEELVQRERKAHVDERHCGDEQRRRQHAGERAREQRIDRDRPAERRAEIAAHVGGGAPRRSGRSRREARLAAGQQALRTGHRCSRNSFMLSLLASWRSRLGGRNRPTPVVAGSPPAPRVSRRGM